ncbi:MAG: superoxide dismutase [Candidatus Delongbacteria bacterium]|jgi:Fe-Mn family superoxide dismutase|nr:superoxide dismutase [Candidatus Delongbacteria bacterium]
MAFTLPNLPFSKDALEPKISKQTLEFHYGKHHQKYVDKLNGLIEGTDYENMSLEDIVVKSEGGIFNNAAQAWNHQFYWESLSPDGGGTPSGKIADAINQQWGSFDNFKDEFSKKAATLFGSGWAWLVKTKEGKLEIIQGQNAKNPMTEGHTPLLTCDVWEHAYYLDVQNKRPDYIENFFDLINWDKIEERYNQ